MFTIEQAQYLLELPKKVELNGKLEDKITLLQEFPFQERYTLISLENEDFTFLYEINQSKKNQFKLTLYLLDEETRIGLLRVDFSGQHENPHTINDKVPAVFHPFVGKFDDTFPVKEILNPNDIITAFKSFNKIIHLETNFVINPLLL